MAAIPSVIHEWQRAVLRVHCAATRLYGSCFVIDAQCGLLWTCSHVVGQVPGTSVRIGAAPDVGQPVAWIYAAQVIHTTPQQEQGGLDGALLRITARLIGDVLQPLALPGDQLTHADGRLLPSLPLGNDGDLQLPGDETAIILGYPALQGTHVMTPTVGIYSNTVRLGDGEWLLTDSTICPGHSGGPALNEHGEVVGWNVRNVQDPIPGIPVSSGINHLRPVRLLIAELEDHAALAAFGGAPPEDIRGHLASQPGCIRGRLFGRAQAAAYAQQAGQHAEQAAGAAAHATEAAGEARDAAVSAQRAVGVQALTIAVSARIDAEAATRREQVALQAYHATQSGQQQRTLSARGEHDAAAQIFRSDVLSGPVRTLWEHSLATAAAGIGSVSVDSALTMPTSHPVLMMVYVDAPIADFTDARVAAFCKKLAGALMNADLKEIRPDQIRVKRKPMAGAAGPDQKRLWRAAVKAGRCYVKVHVSDEYMPSYSSSSGDSSSTSGASLDEDDEDVLEDEEDRQLKEAVKIAVATKIFPGPRVTADTVEPQIIPIPGPIHASSLWLVVQMPAPLALVLLDCAKRRSQQLLDEHVRCMRLVDVGGVLRDQREFVAQLDDRPDIQQCLATLERNESALLDGHLTETKADQRAESASHKWWLQPDEFEGGPTGADSQDGPMIQGLRDGNAEVDIALQKLSLDKAEVEITNGALADNQALLLAQELATNTTVTRLDLSGAHRPPLSVQALQIAVESMPLP